MPRTSSLGPFRPPWWKVWKVSPLVAVDAAAYADSSLEIVAEGGYPIEYFRCMMHGNR